MNDRPHQQSYAGQIIVALIGAISVIIAAILANENFSDQILQIFMTETVTLYASEDFSGSGTFISGNSLLTFAELNDSTDQNLAGPGDDTDDQQIKSFFSFYLGEIPQNATIIEATVNIPCSVYGFPDVLGRVLLKEYAFGQYEQADFYGVPESNWAIGWSGTDVVNICGHASNSTLSFSTNSFKQLVQQRLASQWLQFVFFFQDNLISPNQSLDSVVLTGDPTLIIKYRQ